MAGAVKIAIVGDARGLQTATEEASGALRGLRDRAQSFGENIRRGLQLYAVVEGVDALRRGLTESYEAWEDQLRITKQTEVVVRNAGLAHKLSTKAIEDNAGALSLQTGIADDSIQSATNLLLRNKEFAAEVKKHPELLKKQTSALLDVAVANDKSGKSNLDLTATAKAMSKAYADPAAATSAFAKAGVQLSKQQKEQVKDLAKSGQQAKATALLLDSVGEAVKGAAQKGASPSKQLSANMGQLYEQIGKGVASVVDPAKQALANLIGQIIQGKGPVVALARDIGQTLSPVLAAISSVAGSVGRAIGGMFGEVRRGSGPMADLVRNVRGVMSTVGGAITTMTALAKRELAAFSAGFKSTGGSVRSVVQALSTIVGVVKAVWSAEFGEIRRMVTAAMGGLQQAFRGLGQIVGGVVNLISNIFSGKWKAALGNMGDIAKGAFNLLLGAVRAMAASFGRLLLDGIKLAAKLAVAEIKALPGQVWSIVKSIPKLIGGAGSLMASAGKALGGALVGALKGALGAGVDIAKSMANSLIGLLNRAIPDKLHVPVIGDIDFPDNPIPKFRAGGRLALAAGGMVAAMVSPGEMIISPDNARAAIVPGAPVAADTVPTMLPDGAKVLTWSGQDILARTGSISQALRDQAPHFASGGIVDAVRAARGVGLRGGALQTSVAIAGAESRYKRGAINRNSNGSIDRGGWQINSIHSKYDPARLLSSWDYNAKAMFDISSGGRNWGPWTTYKSGAFRAFMDDAARAIKAAGAAIGGVPMSRVLRAGFAAGLQGSDAAKAVLGAFKTKDQGKTGGSRRDAGLPSAAAISGVKPAIGKYAGAIRQKFGLQVTSTTGGKHAPGSYHYQGRAVDLAGSPAAMNRAAAYIQAHIPKGLMEGIHKPGLSVKNGRAVPSSVWGGVWDRHAGHLHLAMRRGGMVRMSTGGVADVKRLLRSDNVSAGGLAALERALQDVSSSYLMATIQELRESSRRASGSARVVVQKQLGMLAAAAGSRVGAAMKAASASAAGLQRDQTVLGYSQQAAGIDAQSVAGLTQQRDLAAGWLAKAASVQQGLQDAVGLARRKFGATSEQVAEARNALQSFGDQVLATRGQLATLTKSLEQASRTSYQAGTGGASDFAAAKAAFADAQTGSNAATLEWQRARLAAVTAAEAQAEASGDTTQATQLLQEMAQLTAAVREAQSATQAAAEQQAQAVANQQELMRLIQSQSGALEAALAAAVNGSIGPSINLQSATPAWPGATPRL